MSWVRVWIHIVFTTKNRQPFLDASIRRQVFHHINENAVDKNIWLDTVNGYDDHAHCLISLNKEFSLSKTMQLIKGESSFWINKNGLTQHQFNWQDDYWAASVSEEDVARVRKYIINQEKHHAKSTFQMELDKLVKEYAWEHLK